MWWQQMKQNLMIAGFCMAALIIILLTFCGLELEKCRKTK